MKSTAASRKHALRRAVAPIVEILEGRTYMTIAAEFGGGNGTSSVDQYSGTSGSGWDTSWQTTNQNSSFTTATVTNANPLNANGNGNYLSATLTATSGTARGTIARGYENYQDIDVTQLHQVKLDFRVDSALTTFTHADDRVNIFADTGFRFAPTTSDTLLAVAFGAANGGVAAKSWGLINGNSYVDSGVTLSQGTVYHFTFQVDPVNKLYQATISDGQSGTGHSYSSSWLAWDNAVTFNSSDEVYVQVGARVSGSTESISFSFDSVDVSLPASGPTVATAASATPNPVTGSTTALSVLGADDGGESNLTYTWSVVSKPSGASDPTYSANGTNGAKSSTATFYKAGSYTLRATISDGTASVTSDVNVTVNQTLTSIVVSPDAPTVSLNANQQFSASAKDQFGDTLSSQPSFTWSKTSGVGSINASTGLYNSGGTSGSATITATSGAVSDNTSITVNNAGPTVATPAAGPGSNVAGTFTNLSVLGADDGGESNLTYTWSVTSKPSGALNPTFSVNGNNTAKATTTTFYHAGSYTFRATISDGTNSVTSDVVVVVDATLTTITVAPVDPDMALNASQQFSAVAKDQFGAALASQPSFTWSVPSGGGSVNSTGLYTAAGTAGSATVRATSGSVQGNAGLTVSNHAPTVDDEIVADPSPVVGTTTDLTVLGADDGGESNLTYTWSVVSKPSGASNPTFSVSGNNAAKSTTATFTAAGNYTLRVNISDGSLSVTDDIALVVNPAAPSSPSNLQVTAVSPTQVDLTWTDNSNNETGFTVERKIGTGGTYQVIGSTVANATSFTDYTAAEGLQYYYRVKANNSGGSVASSEVEEVTPLVAPSNVRVTSVSPTSKLITWADNSDAESGYRIEKWNGTEWVSAGTAGPDATSFTDPEATPGAQDYRVRTTKSGSEQYTSAAGANSQVAPQQPTLDLQLNSLNPHTAIDVEYSVSDGASLVLEWKASGIDKNYHVYGALTSTPGSHTTTISGLSRGTRYDFRIKALKGGQVTYVSAGISTALPDVSDPYFTGSLTPPTILSLGLYEGSDPSYAGYLEVQMEESSGGWSGWEPPIWWDQHTWTDLSGLGVPNVVTIRADRVDDPYGIQSVHAVGYSGHIWPMTDSETGNLYGIASLVGAEGSTVNVRLSAYNEADPAISNWSEPFAYTFDGELLPALSLSVAPSSTPGNVILSWTGQSSANDYVMVYRVDAGDPGPGKAHAVTSEDGVSASAGQLEVAAGSAGERFFVVQGHPHWQSGGPYSNFVDATGATNVVAAPTNLAAYPVNPDGKGAINLVWDNIPNNETGYTIQRKVTGGTWQDLATVDPDVTSYTDTKAQLYGVTYSYQVKATGSGGDSTWSNTASVAVKRVFCESCQRSIGARGSEQASGPVMSANQGQLSHATSTGSGGTMAKPSYLALLGGTSSAPSALSVVYGQNQQSYFDWNTTDSVYVEGFGGTGTIVHTGGQYILTESSGRQFIFNDTFTEAEPALEAQFQSQKDAGGNTSNVADRDGAGRPTKINITDHLSNPVEQWLYEYVTSGVNEGQTTKVIQKIWNGVSYSTIRSQTHTYYDGSTAHGSAGDLKSTVVRDGSENILSTQYYRYYTAGQGGGYEHAVKYILSDESIARAKAAYSVTSMDSLTNAQIAPYADVFYQYDELQRIVLRRLQGAGCSSCTGGQGTYTYSYASSAHDEDFNKWSDKVVETRPDGNQGITYYNYLGQAMLEITREVSSGKMWGTYHVYDSAGREVMTANPSALELPSSLATIEAYDDLLHNVSGDYEYIADTSGILQLTDYDANGYVAATSIRRGDTTTAVLQSQYTYEERTAANGTIFVLDTSTVFRGEGGSGGQETDYDYTWYTDSLQASSQTVKLPVVSAGQNGPGGVDHDTTTFFFDRYGRTTWTKDAEGYLTYSEYDPITGGLKTFVQDASAATGSPTRGNGATLPAALNLTAEYEVDRLGRTTKDIDPNGNVTYIVYKDAAREVRTYRGWNAATKTTTGPIEVYRQDLAGGYTESLTFSWSGSGGLPVDEFGAPDGTESLTSSSSTVHSLSRSYTNAGRQVTETRAYFNLAGLSYSSAADLGTKDTHYYATTYGYDQMGRQNLTISPTGTISRVVYDLLGRTTDVWVGTDDDGATSYQPFNSGSVLNNMTQVAEYEYDGGGIGDGNLTKQTEIPGGDADDRVTETYYDWRNRKVATRTGVNDVDFQSNTRFISYVAYNNLNQATAREVYFGVTTNPLNSAELIPVEVNSTDGVPDRPDAELLRAKEETAYDEQGRVYRSTNYSVDPTSGSVSSGLATNLFYDRRGLLKQTLSPSGQATIFAYDGAQRQISRTDSDPDGSGPLASPVTYFTYDGNGNLVATTDPLGRSTFYEYDAAGRITQTVYADPDDAGPLISPTLVNQYDDAGRLGAVTDPNGNTTEYQYDNLGRITSTIQADPDDAGPLENPTTEYAYDGDGRLVSSIDAAGRTTTYGYDVFGNNTIVTLPDPDGVGSLESPISSTTYNQLGEVTSQTDARGRTTDFTYDSLGRLTGATLPSPDGIAPRPQYSASYNTAGQKESATDTLGNETTYSYDGFGRLIGTSLPDPDGVGPLARSVLGRSYDDAGNVLSATDANGNTTSYEYDSLNRVVTITKQDPDDSGPLTSPTTHYSYNAASEVINVTDPNDGVTEYTYDKLGRLVTTTLPDPDDSGPLTPSQLRYEYDANSNQTAFVDALGNRTSYEFDALNRVTAFIEADPDGAGVQESPVTQYEYDIVGNLTKITDPVGNTTTYSYDALDRQISETNALGKSRTTRYDANGNLVSATDRNGRTTEFTYDDLNRRTSETWIDGSSTVRTITYEYDAASRLVFEGDADSSYSYGYNGMGQVVSIDNLGTPNSPHVELTYSYDANGNGISMIAELEGTVDLTNEYQYDGLDRLTGITQSGPGTLGKRVNFGYDSAGQRTAIHRYPNTTGSGSALTTSSTYDRSGRLTSLSHDLGSTSLDYDWEFDSAGRVTSVTSPDGVVAYEYDANGQLLAASGSGGSAANEAYSYDANGNRTTSGYSTDDDNRVLSDGTYTYAYDDEGNRIRRTDSATGEKVEYEWDHRNRLTGVTFKNSSGIVTGSVRYTYDVNDKRIAKEVLDGSQATVSEEHYVYSGSNLLYTADGAGAVIERYLTGAGVSEVFAVDGGSNWEWLLTDNQGSVTDVIDGVTGSSVNHLVYDSFGNIVSQSNASAQPRFTFAGLQSDAETGLSYAWHRYYDSRVGRFLNQDPIGFAAGDGNLYRYVGNSPTMAVDPIGLASQSDYQSAIESAESQLRNVRDAMQGSAELNENILAQYRKYLESLSKVDRANEDYLNGQGRLSSWWNADSDAALHKRAGKLPVRIGQLSPTSQDLSGLMASSKALGNAASNHVANVAKWDDQVEFTRAATREFGTTVLVGTAVVVTGGAAAAVYGTAKVAIVGGSVLLFSVGKAGYDRGAAGQDAWTAAKGSFLDVSGFTGAYGGATGKDFASGGLFLNGDGSPLTSKQRGEMCGKGFATVVLTGVAPKVFESGYRGQQLNMSGGLLPATLPPYKGPLPPRRYELPVLNEKIGEWNVVRNGNSVEVSYGNIGKISGSGNPNYAFISDVTVIEPFQGRGLGTELYGKLLSELGRPKVVEGVPGGINLTVLETPGKTILDTPRVHILVKHGYDNHVMNEATGFMRSTRTGN